MYDPYPYSLLESQVKKNRLERDIDDFYEDEDEDFEDIEDDEDDYLKPSRDAYLKFVLKNKFDRRNNNNDDLTDDDDDVENDEDEENNNDNDDKFAYLIPRPLFKRNTYKLTKSDDENKINQLIFNDDGLIGYKHVEYKTPVPSKDDFIKGKLKFFIFCSRCQSYYNLKTKI